MSVRRIVFVIALFGTVSIHGEPETFPEHTLSSGDLDFAQHDFKSSAIGDGSISHGSSNQHQHQQHQHQHQPAATSYQSFFLESKNPVPVKISSDHGNAVEYPQLPHFLPQDFNQPFNQIQFSQNHDQGQQQHVVLQHTQDGQQVFTTHQQNQDHQVTNHQQVQDHQIVQSHSSDTQQISHNNNHHQSNNGFHQDHLVNIQHHQPTVVHDNSQHTFQNVEEASQVGYHPGDQTFIPPPQHEQQQLFTPHQTEFQNTNFQYEIQENPRYHHQQ